MSVLQQNGSITYQTLRGAMSSGQPAGWTAGRFDCQFEQQTMGTMYPVARLPASEASLQQSTAGHCIRDLNGNPQCLSRAACLEIACPGHPPASSFGLCQLTYCLALPEALSAASVLQLGTAPIPSYSLQSLLQPQCQLLASPSLWAQMIWWTPAGRGRLTTMTLMSRWSLSPRLCTGHGKTPGAQAADLESCHL